jgi:hypothetical protein
MDYTTTALLTKIKTWAAVPTGQPAFSNVSLLDLLTDELRTNLAPWLMRFREEYFVRYTDYPITSAEAYMIPTKAIGGVAREICTYNSNNEFFNVTRIELEQLPTFASFAFYLKGNYIMLVRAADKTSETLRVYYQRMPNELVTEAACAKITHIDTVTKILTVSSAPAAWTGTQTIDLVQGKPPFDELIEDESITVSGTALTMTSAVPSNLAVGDWVCLAGTAPVAQIPWEMYGMLCQAVVVRINEILDDQQGLEKSINKYKQMEDRMSDTISPRVIGEHKAIFPTDAFIS